MRLLELLMKEHLTLAASSYYLYGDGEANLGSEVSHRFSILRCDSTLRTNGHVGYKL